MPLPGHWDHEADVVIVGYGFAGVAAAITAHDADAKVLILEKAPEKYKGGNSRVSGNGVFWPSDVEKAKTYFRAMSDGYMDHISDEMLHVWAMEMHANRRWLEALGWEPVSYGGAEYPDLDTAMLLAEDPFVGGYVADGPRLSLSDALGLGIERR